MKRLFSILFACAMLSVAYSCSSSKAVDLEIHPNTETKPYYDISLSTAPAEILMSDLESDPANEGLSDLELLQLAIAQVSEGGVIGFEAKEYSYTQNIVIDKSLVFRGVGSLPEDDTTIGSGVVETSMKFDSGHNFNVTSSGVSMESIKIFKDEIENGEMLVKITGECSDCSFVNMIFGGSFYQLSPSSGMTSRLRCAYTTFTGFCFRGFQINRSVTNFPTCAMLEKMIIFRCYFKPNDPTRSNSRAISIDAGNTEYPNILDFDGTDIRECHFEDCSFASSKCRNFNIVDCTFYVEKVHDYPIHLEEYTRDLLIEGCTFTCNETPENLISVADYTTIRNNRVVGKARGFIQGANCEYFSVYDNDLSELQSVDGAKSSYDINLWGADGYRNITIKNNQAHSLTYKIMDGCEETMDISEPTAKIETKSNTGYLFPFEEGEYRIRNVASDCYLTAGELEQRLTMESSVASDGSDIWILTKVWPNRYEVKNKANGGYLFVWRGGEDALAGAMLNYPPMTYSFAQSERKPIWDLSKVKKSDDFAPIIPGGDERAVLQDNQDRSVDQYGKSKGADVTKEKQLWHFEMVK